MSKDGAARGSGFSTGLISGLAVCALAASTAAVLMPLEKSGDAPMQQSGLAAPDVETNAPEAPAQNPVPTAETEPVEEDETPLETAGGEDDDSATNETTQPVAEAAEPVKTDDADLAGLDDADASVMDEALAPETAPELPAVADVALSAPAEMEQPEAPVVPTLSQPDSPANADAPELGRQASVSQDAPNLPRQPDALASGPAPEVDAGVEVSATPSAPRVESPATEPVATANTPDAAPQAPATNVALPAVVAGTSPEQPDAGDGAGEAAILLPDAEAEIPSETGAGDSLAVSDSAEKDVVAETESGPPPAPILTGPAFEVLAADFQSDGRPMLAIVLEYVGEAGLARDDLLDVPSAYTFALTSGGDDLLWSDHMFREAGFEVVALIPGTGEARLGQGTDEAEVSGLVERYLTDVPGALAVMDAPGGDLFRNARVVAALSDTLAVSGRGLFIHERFGVNSALQTVRGAGVPAASVLRVIDESRDADAIRRNLDRAALDAKKSGAVVIFGHTYPETMSTLLTWQLGRTAEGVQIAPVTAVVRRLSE